MQPGMIHSSCGKLSCAGELDTLPVASAVLNLKRSTKHHQSSRTSANSILLSNSLYVSDILGESRLLAPHMPMPFHATAEFLLILREAARLQGALAALSTGLMIAHVPCMTSHTSCCRILQIVLDVCSEQGHMRAAQFSLPTRKSSTC